MRKVVSPPDFGFSLFSTGFDTDLLYLVVFITFSSRFEGLLIVCASRHPPRQLRGLDAQRVGDKRFQNLNNMEPKWH